VRIPFRQGIVRSQLDITQNPNFLQKTTVGINLLTNNGPLVLSLSHGASEYSHTEDVPITNAWPGIFQSGSDYWLFLDLDLLTAASTFGFTSLPPYTGPTPPPLPATDQHWFDTTNMKHKVWNQTVSQWVERIRIFVARLENGNTIEYDYPIGDSQVGVSRSMSNLANFYPSGRILFSDSGNPVSKATGEFFTSEDKFHIGASRVDSVRLESNVLEAVADQIISGFSVVKFNSFGKLLLAQYADIGNATLAIVTGDLMIGGKDSVIVQGAITNPTWQNNGWVINDLLWVKDNGELVNQDPNITNFSSYPTKQVPIARVIKDDTIIFEQGLGGVGKTGPASVSGGGGTSAPATDTEFGTVKLLNSTSSNIVVSTDASRLLVGPYASQVHGHVGQDVSITPVGDITASEVQSAFGQVAANKLSKLGDVLTGYLTLHANPVNDFHPATKLYVDNLVNGLVWKDPVKFINIIADNLMSAPPFPNFSDMYIVATGATGPWNGLAGRLVQWDGLSWLDRGLLSSQPAGTRFGVAMETNTTPQGSFIGNKNSIAILDNPVLGTWTFIIPNQNESVLVNNADSIHAYHQYVFDGIRWVEFAGPSSVIAGNNVTLTGNIIDTKDFGAGGTIDARFLQGYQPSDFVLSTGDSLTGPLLLSGNPTVGLEATTKDYVDTAVASGGAPLASNISFAPTGNLSGANVQIVLQELDTEKLGKVGGSLTGALTLSGNPTNANHAANKAYVDTGISSITPETVGYKHTQTISLVTWTITHGLGTEFINVSVFVNISATWTQMIPTNVEIVDSNNVQLTFSTARSGRAVIVGVL